MKLGFLAVSATMLTVTFAHTTEAVNTQPLGAYRHYYQSEFVGYYYNKCYSSAEYKCYKKAQDFCTRLSGADFELCVNVKKTRCINMKCKKMLLWW